MAPLFSVALWAIGYLLLALPSLSAADDETWYKIQNNDGSTSWLLEGRKPSLYTTNFGSCLENSLIDVTRFDAAFYHDNMTVIFDIGGNTQLNNESLMIYIGVYAYGESRFELPFDPCKANIASMCPVYDNVTITANGQIPIAPSDISMIPEIAYSIPDFEGQAILRIFANSTQSEIACYSAVVTNGATFSHPNAVGSILGAFAVIAMAASFVSAIYGNDIATMRTHYAHSLSVLVVFAVYHHIFFTGALSMNWPSVLVAFWSNYAWSAGIINVPAMQDAFDKLTRNHRGDTLTLGAAGSGTWASNVGGGFDIHQIYKRAQIANSPDLVSSVEHMLSKRADGGSNLADTKYMGHLVRDGLPLPGNYSGFPGTLYQVEIPASNAFLTAATWYAILLLAVGFGVILFKFVLEALYKVKIMKTSRLDYFRAHYLGYTAAALARTFFIAFFAMMFLTIFQFSYSGSPAVMAIAAIVFTIFFVGIVGIAAYACYYKLRFDTWQSIMERHQLQRTTKFGFVPWFRTVPAPEAAPVSDSSDATPVDEKILAMDDKSMGLGDSPVDLKSVHWPSASTLEMQKSIHNDEDYTKKFGWLSSRHRRTKWWFFAAWVVYEFVRACFFAGASGHGMVQVFGLLVVEFIAFLAIIKMRPFEGQRLNVILVYLLGFSKVSTVALSAAFDISFNLGRITTTAIGIVIIVIQGVVTIVLMICVLLSAVTSYFSVMRYRETIKPKSWIDYRQRYFKHLDQAVRDRPVTPPPRLPTPPPEEPKGPYFSVNTVKRAPKIEDEDPEFLAEITTDPRLSMSKSSVNMSGFYDNREGSSSRLSRAMSTSSRRSTTNLPYGARLHRASWSTKDFSEFNDGQISSPDVASPYASDGTTLASESRLAQPRTSHDSLPSPQFAYTVPPVPRMSAEQLRRASDMSAYASSPSSPVGSAHGVNWPSTQKSPSRSQSRRHRHRPAESIDESHEH